VTRLPHKRLHAIARGRVQGVGYRATVQYEARKLGLSGWVRNRVDGTVEVEAEGPAAALETFLSFLQRGPLGAHVDAVEAQWLPPQGGGPHPFEVRRTS
jgi:acylphosphatase